jgi:hypothetical protein
MILKFVSYDGDYPNLCSGKLIMSIDGANIEWPDASLSPGGTVSWDDEDETVAGDWAISRWPADFPEALKAEAVELVNDNVHHGCCGGCL